MKNFVFAISALVWTQFLWAQEQQAAANQPTPNFIETVLPFALIFLVMYLLLIRPQSKRAKEHATLLQGLKSGDEVVTTGGIIGRIRSIADGFVTLEIGNTTMKVMKENVSTLTKKPEPANAASSKK